uniref:Anion exchange protein n=1 Tax=Macrostomum lignano TaxID=282301 RepID=A0A1I8IHB1_9PLAT
MSAVEETDEDADAEAEDAPPSFGSLAADVTGEGSGSASVSREGSNADPSVRVHFLLGNNQDSGAAEDEPLTAVEDIRPLFCQMNELDCSGDVTVWKQTARWIKFEEDVEEGGERWSKPHVATLSLLSLFEVRTAISTGEVMLDCEAQSFESIVDLMLNRLVRKDRLPVEYREQTREVLLKKHWNLHQKRLVRGSSFLGSKIRNIAEIGKRHSSKDLERDSSFRNSPSGVGLGEALGDSADATQPHSSGSKHYDQSFMRKVPPGAETANILVGSTSFLPTGPVACFIRLKNACLAMEITEVPVPSRFLFVLLSPPGQVDSLKEMGRCMGTLMSDEIFREVAYLARGKGDLLAGLDEFLKFCIVLPPNEWDPSIRIEPPKEVPSQDVRKQHSSANLSALNGAGEDGSQSANKIEKSSSGQQLKLKEASFDAEKLPSPPPPPPLQQQQSQTQSDSEGHFDASLERTGRLFGGLTEDVKRKLPFYLSDVKDAIHVQTIGAFFFIYFACLTPIITFGGLLVDATEGYLGAMESILSGAICGTLYALCSGQPLTILGSTGPVLVFETIVFKMCKEWHWDYLSLRMWIGLWIFVILMLIVAFDLSALVKYITRFTEESFAALIALIFIVEAIKKLLHIASYYPINKSWHPKFVSDFNCSCELDPSVNASERKPLMPGQRYFVPSYPRPYGDGNGTEVRYFANYSQLDYWDWESSKYYKYCINNQGVWSGSGCGKFAVPDVFFFSCLLFLGTFGISYGLKMMRNSRFFPNRVRSIISDFAVMLAIVAMTLVDLLMGLHTPKLHVPDTFSPTLGYETRGWIVPPFGSRGQNPAYSAIFALLPALLATILIFMDQQITAVIVNRKENKLKKGLGYHLDLLIVAVLIGINSILGIPWFVAATVLSINHVMALKIESETTAPGERPKFLGCRENRVTGFLIFLLIGLSVFLTPVLKHIPMPVLYGVFLFMGISSLRGVQLVQRVGLFFMPQKYQPDYRFLRHVKIIQVHKFTIIQVACLALLWAVKVIKQVSILFPIMVLAMCFIRKALDYVFAQNELKWLDDIMPELTLKPKTASSRAASDIGMTERLGKSGDSSASGLEKKSSANVAGTQPNESEALLLPGAPEVNIVVEPPSPAQSPIHNATRMVGCDLAVNWRKIGEDLSEYRLMKQAAEIGHLAQCLLSADNTSEAVWYSSHNRTCHEFVCNRGPNGCRKCRNAIRADATVTQVWIRAQPSGQFNCWKTFQHRVSSNLSFDKNWTDYSTGFGLEEADNFWLGLEQIHQLTKHRGRRVRWELSDWDKKWYWTENFNFTVSGPEDKYRAVIGEFDSAASSIGQAMTTSDVGIQGNQFSTRTPITI